MLEQLATWNAIHGEAIFGTRPWLVYGESSVKVKGGAFKEDFKYNSKEIRFTTKGATLYATALGWPEDGQLVVRSLAKPAGENINNITGVSLLGYSGKLEWKQTPEGLIVKLPAQKVSEFTAGLKITGTELKNVPLPATVTVLAPDAKGNLKLSADDADLQGDGIKAETKGNDSNLGYWDKGTDWASWKAKFTKPAKFNVTASCASISGASEFVVEVAGQKLNGKAAKTDNWDTFQEINLGQVEIKQAGDQTVSVRPQDANNWKAMNLRYVKFTKVD
jgi:alpha-L-fucosidase